MNGREARRFGGGKLVAGGAAFALLTVGIFWYQFHRMEAGDATPHWADRCSSGSAASSPSSIT